MGQNLHPASFRTDSVVFTADPLTIDLSAVKLAKPMADMVAQRHRERIPLGQKADGSGAQEGRSFGDHKIGHESGKLAQSFKSKTSGTKSDATATVAPTVTDKGRLLFLAKHGDTLVFEGVDGTPLGAELDTLIETFMDAAIK